MKDPSASAGGGVGLGFAVDFKVPKFVQEAQSKGGRRSLQELNQINVARDIATLELVVQNEDAPMQDL